MSQTPDRWSVSLSGVTLLDRYAVERKMGGGGMATVYLAKDEHLGLPVVVKVPHPAFLADPSFRTRFEQETEGLIALQHPHIVRILARGEHDGLPFLVMQYLRGGSLGDRLRKAGGPLPFEELAPWIPGVTEALDFIHAQGVVHRDIKPDNVLFDEHGYVYLSDFGIAKAIGADDTGLTATGATPGSPAYMAPEQARTSNLGGSSDQYSLAASLYEALSGTPTYDGETLVDVLLKKQSEDPAPLAEVAPHVPAAAADAIMRALSRDPAGRFPTCAAFREALLGRTEPTREVETVATRPAVPPPPDDAAPRPARPARTTAGSPPETDATSRLAVITRTLVALAVLVAAGVFVANALRDDEEPRPSRTPRIVGRYVIDAAALERRVKERGRPPRPRAGRPVRKPDPEAWMKQGMDLHVRADGTFSMGAPSAPGRPGPAEGTWRRTGEGQYRFETQERDGRTPRVLLGRRTAVGLTLRMDRFEIPFRRAPEDPR